MAGLNGTQHRRLTPAPCQSCRVHPRRRHRQPKRRGACVATRAEDASAQAGPATAADANQVAQLDDLINKLLACTDQEQFGKVVAENIMAFDQPFWLRIAARADTASGADKARLSSLASTVMLLVEKMVQATEEQLTDSGSILQEILKAGADDNGKWVKPLPETQIEGMRQAMEEHSESLDEALLSNCFAYIKKASDDGVTEVVYALQKILQLYAARQLGQLETTTPDDAMLMDVLQSDEAQWDEMIEGLASAGDLSEASFTTALQKRMEGTVLGLQSGSYSQRVQAEYLKEVESRGKAVYAKLAEA